MRLPRSANTLLTAASIIALAAPAVAGGYGVAYVGLRGSIVETESSDTTSPSIDYAESYDDIGFTAAAFMGWVLDDKFRLEGEAAFRAADLESIHLTRDDINPLLEDQDYAAGGHAFAGSFMANLYYDIHWVDIGVLPWIGAGIGAAYIDYEIFQPTVGLAAQDQVWAFAYQAMAGVTVPVADSVSMSVGYRFFQTEDFTYVDAFGDNFQTDLTQHSVEVGVQVHL